MSRLLKEAERRGVRVPTPATLRRYGITAEEWLEMLADQDWVCPICQKAKVIWNVDHEHVPLWKKRPPSERCIFVRGILCAGCNYQVVHSHITAETAQRVADYLKKYEERRNKCLSGLT